MLQDYRHEAIDGNMSDYDIYGPLIIFAKYDTRNKVYIGTGANICYNSWSTTA